jgi:hypothetical protein
VRALHKIHPTREPGSMKERPAAAAACLFPVRVRACDVGWIDALFT